MFVLLNMLNRIHLMEGRKISQQTYSRAYFAETFSTVSCVIVGSSMCSCLPCKIAFFQFLGIAAIRPP